MNQINEIRNEIRKPNQRTHVGVSGILYERGQILLGKRCDNDDAFAGFWNTPGGGLNFRETVSGGIAREFLEETGLNVRVKLPEEFRFVHEALSLPDRHTILIFSPVERLAGIPQALDGLSEVRWFTWQEVREAAYEGILTPGTSAALNAFWNHENVPLDH